MTARQGLEALLIELSKENAPSILLSDYNYLINKAIYQYINKQYTIYDINQQTTDALRVLKSTAILEPSPVNTQQVKSEVLQAGLSKLLEGTYEIYFPLDYLHILNCVCIYKVENEGNRCQGGDEFVQFGATRLTADSWSEIMGDYYNRPLPQRPYYYIHNVNTSTVIPTNPINANKALESNTVGTDSKQDYVVSVEDDSVTVNSNLPRTISLKAITNNSVVKREAGVRYGNSSSIRCEIRCGQNSNYQLIGVMIDYLKAPQTIELTQEQIDLTEDTSQIFELPDYACNEIINELVHLVMGTTSDPRLSVHSSVTPSIAAPVQQQTPYQYAPRRRRSESQE